MRSMKKLLALPIVFALFFSTVAFAAPLYVFQKTIIPEIDSTYTLGTTTKAWLNIYTDEVCLAGDCKTAWPTGGGGGGGSDTLWALNTSGNYVYSDSASTTATTSARSYFFTATSTADASTFPLASTTAMTAVRAYITQLANLTSNGFVKTGSGNGTLSIDTTTYESGLTAGDGLTRTVNDFDFDGGDTPQGELGGTWASPTIDDSLAVTSWNLTTPTFTTSFTFDAETLDSLTDDVTLANNAGDLQVVDVTCTDCLNATEIEDIYLLIAGDTSSGAYTWTGQHTFNTASSTGFTSTNLYSSFASTSNASTTNLTVHGNLWSDFSDGCLSVTSGLIGSTGVACGSGSGGSNWLFQSGGLRPSTTVGIVVSASSTIGNGTGIGGLTISGSATTTGTSTVQTLHVKGSTAATSTAYIYSSTAGLGGQFIVEDSDAAGCTLVTALNGVLSASTVTCPAEQ